MRNRIVWLAMATMILALVSTAYLKDRRDRQLIETLAKAKIDLSLVSDQLWDQERDRAELTRQLHFANKRGHDFQHRDRQLAELKEGIEALRAAEESRGNAVDNYEGTQNAVVDFDSFFVDPASYLRMPQDVPPEELFEWLSKLPEGKTARQFHTRLRTLIWSAESKLGKRILEADGLFGEPSAPRPGGSQHSYMNRTYPTALSQNRGSSTFHQLGTGTHGQDLLVPFALESYSGGLTTEIQLVRTGNGIVAKTAYSPSLPVSFESAPFGLGIATTDGAEGAPVRELRFPFVKQTGASLSSTTVISDEKRHFLGVMELKPDIEAAPNNAPDRNAEGKATSIAEWKVVVFLRVREL